MADTKLTPEVQDVLAKSTITRNVLVLPGQMSRELYEAVNKVLKNAGGKWKRGTGHVFTSDPRAKLGLVLETGVSVDERKKYQAFYTPPELARFVAEAGDVSGRLVLEPSAGHGALADACMAAGALGVACVELQPESAAILKGKGYATDMLDFLAIEPLPIYERVVMNPPFTKGQDVKHVVHALKWLSPRGRADSGGRLVSVVMGSARDMEAKWKKALAPHPFSLFDLPEGSFKESGTAINTSLLTIQF